MKKILVLNKKEGETPLETLNRFRKVRKAYKDVPMTYAGRLDPMASGLLLVLAGEETKNKAKYLKFSKEYEFEVLFGFSTDTYDVLGKALKSYEGLEKKELEKKIQQNLTYFRGKFIQPYPLYSSKTIKKARAGIPIEAPEREVSVKELNFIKIRQISRKSLLKNIEKRIEKVEGNFRQAEIIKIWKKKLGSGPGLMIASFRIKCGSGTYVRGIADSLGQKIKIPALAYSIRRTKIGNYRRGV